MRSMKDSDRVERPDSGPTEDGSVMTRTTDTFRPYLAAVALVLASLLTAASAGAAEDNTVCAAISIGSDQPGTVLFVDGLESGNTLAWGATPTISSAEIIDIDFVIGFDGPLTGDHLLELRIRTPNGHIFQTLTTPITTNAQSVGETSVAGFPRPLPVQLLEPESVRGRSLPSAEVPFPVGGTTIATNSLFGLWSVEPFLDGHSVACGEVARFIVVY